VRRLSQGQVNYACIQRGDRAVDTTTTSSVVSVVVEETGISMLQAHEKNSTISGT
jgi:hypothetical protein